MITRIKNYAFIFFACLSLHAPVSFAADAGPGEGGEEVEIAPQPCDPQFYRQMQSRAWLESEREIMQNQNLIFKPDTIMDYVCFDRFLGEAAWDGGDIFTHTTYFGEEIIPRGAANALENTINNVVFYALEAYRNENFNHSWLGGRGEFMGLPEFDPNFITSTPLLEGSAYTCDVMSRVWQTAKCMNFVDVEEFEPTDGYYPLETLACGEGAEDCEEIEGYDEINEVRNFPLNMACDGPAGVRTWDELIEEADNRDEIFYDFESPLGEVFEDIEERTAPGECEFAILTGIQIIDSQGDTGLEDGVCPNPGCSFYGGACSAAGGGGAGGGGEEG